MLCNIATKGAAYCEMLHQKAVLPSLVNILVFSDVQVVGQDLELLHLIFLYWPKVDFNALCITVLLYILKVQDVLAVSILMCMFFHSARLPLTL